MMEVHPHPDQSISDAKQTISPETFAMIMKKCRLLVNAMQAGEEAHALPC